MNFYFMSETRSRAGMQRDWVLLESKLGNYFLFPWIQISLVKRVNGYCCAWCCVTAKACKLESRVMVDREVSTLSVSNILFRPWSRRLSSSPQHLQRA
eukprot:2162224-Amphidinium_carterae.1